MEDWLFLTKKLIKSFIISECKKKIVQLVKKVQKKKLQQKIAKLPHFYANLANSNYVPIAIPTVGWT